MCVSKAHHTLLARLLALAVPGDKMRSRLSEPQASEAIPHMPTIKLRQSEGETAHSGEASGHKEDESPITTPMPAKSER